MGRTSPQDLTLGHVQAQLRKKEAIIATQADQITKLKRIIQEICETFNVPEPDLRFEHYVPVTVMEADDHALTDLLVGTHENLGDRILAEMIRNRTRKGHQYSVEIKQFCSLIFMRSPTAYKVMSEVLPVPHSDTITRFLKPCIHSISSRVESGTGAREILRELKESFSLDDPILCTIAVDACSHSNHLHKQDSTQSFSKEVKLEEFLEKFGVNPEDMNPAEVHKYCFAFYVEPLCPKIPCTPVYMCSERTGKAYSKHVTILWELQRIAREEGFLPVMLCSDGDSEYYCQQREGYRIVREYCQDFQDINDVAVMGRELLSDGTLFCSDMLHLLKNARTRMLSPNVSMNVRHPRRINVRMMNDVLHLPDDCFRDEPLNKMMDSLPLLIFTFDNAKKLWQNGLNDESMFVLTFALFQGFFRAQCSHATRVGIGITFLRIVARYIEYFKKTTSDCTCRCLEFHRKGAFVTLFPSLHLERMIVTVATTLSLILALPDGLEISLNRCSTHPLENFFGLLRTFCNFKHTYSNIRDKVARTQVMKMFKTELGMDTSIRTRASIAGERVRVANAGSGIIDTDYSLGIMCVIDGFYAEKELGIEVSPVVYSVMGRFLDILSGIELPTAKTQGKYSGLQIMNRLIANSRG